MNERIRELAKWAGYNGHYATEEFDVDEFARLIVLECALTVQDFVDHRFPASEYPDRLKKYFGVEL